MKAEVFRPPIFQARAMMSRALVGEAGFPSQKFKAYYGMR